jgi:hypothetical protein
MLEIYRVVAHLVASRVVLSSTELVSIIKRNDIKEWDAVACWKVVLQRRHFFGSNQALRTVWQIEMWILCCYSISHDNSHQVCSFRDKDYLISLLKDHFRCVITYIQTELAFCETSLISALAHTNVLPPWVGFGSLTQLVLQFCVGSVPNNRRVTGCIPF